MEELLDLASPDGLVFAHELAHLVLFHASDELQAQVASLHERAMEDPFVATHYALSNDDEFFAVAYCEYLRDSYGWPRTRPRDSVGIDRAFDELFSGLAMG